MTSAFDSFDERGYAVITDILSHDQRARLLATFDASSGRAGRRDGLRFEAVREAASSPAVLRIVHAILGDRAFAVKATLFGKSSATNWLVPWHQDVMIPVAQRRTVPGYEAWSVKGGIPHVRPPRGILDSMLAIRLDLDGTTEQNGALRVLPGTHSLGRLSGKEICGLMRQGSADTCLVPACGALVMRPLLLHASSKNLSSENRRIVHLEFAGSPLSDGLEWFDWKADAAE